MSAVLPQAISISDGTWAIATQKQIDLCRGEPTRTLGMIPLGCSSFGVSISFPPYYQVEEKYEEWDSLLETFKENPK